MSNSSEILLSLAAQFEALATSGLVKKAGVTVQFRPGEVKDLVQLAIEFSGGKYEYHPQGSKVAFTGKQFASFIDFLQSAVKNEEMFDEKDKAAVQDTINYVMSKLPSA